MTARAQSNCIRGRSSLCSNMAAGSAALCQDRNNTRTHFPNSFPFGDTVHWFRGKPFAQISITKRSLVIIILLSCLFILFNQLHRLKRRTLLRPFTTIYKWEHVLKSAIDSGIRMEPRNNCLRPVNSVHNYWSMGWGQLCVTNVGMKRERINRTRLYYEIGVVKKLNWNSLILAYTKLIYWI